ncbi:MAG: hypothetical protein EBQ56_00105, partial [Proteobacteria bacterium]|nr:hypothetical protein [Pseudomonadota bacterium]
ALSIDPSYTTIGQSLASDRRVGDIIPVDLKLTATTIVRNATSLNAVITFPSADFVLVTSATDAAPVSATTGVGAVINSTGFAFGTGALASAPGAANTFRVASSLPTITLKIDGAALALAANDVKTVGRFYVRPKYNGDTSSATKNLTIAANPSLGIRASDGGSLGFTTTVTGAGDFRVAVAKTTVTLSLKVADPAESTRKHRTGDTIQVELQVAASDIARNATSLDATITVPSADYVLVNAPTPSKVVATAPVVKTTNGVAFGNAFTSKGGSSADETNNSLSGDTITLKIDGTALNLDQTPVTIGTFYVRPKYNGDTSGAPKNLTIGASPMIGIRASDTNAGYTVGDLGFTFEAGVNGDGSTARVAVDPTTLSQCHLSRHCHHRCGSVAKSRSTSRSRQRTPATSTMSRQPLQSMEVSSRSSNMGYWQIAKQSRRPRLVPTP